ncbi:hypothetical protein VaNZ11_002829 [Volvox africanus]|uniref:Uncharacterized protein n=1 Tax=Volvox africanus TaxID=51714 RepID=A0ABQ5RSP4_9CHLO|nr:hypothetical protein VaNZ11_002829 [Volvox africanus]
MSQTRTELLCRRKVSAASYYKHVTRPRSMHRRIWSKGYCIQPFATNKDLVGLGLPSEDLAKVEEAIAKTQAIDVSDSIKILTAYAGSTTSASVLVRKHPNLLCCQLSSWVEFLTAFGLTKAQVQHVLCQTPEALIEGDLIRAGESLLTFRRLGLSDYAAAQLVTYYPQLLSKGEDEIRDLLRLLVRYQTGIDSLGC